MSRSIKAVDCSLSICAGYSLAPIACCGLNIKVWAERHIGLWSNTEKTWKVANSMLLHCLLLQFKECC